MTTIIRALLWPLAYVVGWVINTAGEAIDGGNTELLDRLDTEQDT